MNMVGSYLLGAEVSFCNQTKKGASFSRSLSHVIFGSTSDMHCQVTHAYQLHPFWMLSLVFPSYV